MNLSKQEFYTDKLLGKTDSNFFNHEKRDSVHSKMNQINKFAFLSKPDLTSYAGKANSKK